MTMPYYDLVEPITGYYCAKGGMGRLDYWGGVERYIYNASGQGYQIVPTAMDGENSQETCFLSGENMAPVSLFPDLTNFPTEPDAGPCDVNGVACAAFTLDSPTFDDDVGFIGNYTLYVDATSGAPLRFHFTGFNVVLGSHYDEYIFDYLKVVPTLEGVAPECFAPPQDMTCAQLETDDDDSGGPTVETAKKSLGARRPKTDPSLPLAELGSLLEPLSKVPDLNLKPVTTEDVPAVKASVMAGAHANFDAWALKHAKEYSSATLGSTSDYNFEYGKRRALFVATSRYVNSMNRRGLSFWLGINHMADWTHEERTRLRGRLHTPEGTTDQATTTHVRSPGDLLPTDVDWRERGAVTPPKDQGSCGSCWSYGATGTTEGQVFLKTGVLTPLSQQNLMDCSWSEGNDACDGGLDFRGYNWMMKHGGGLATEASYPYLNADGYCRFSSSTVGARVSGYANVTDGVPGLNDALVNVGPISVSIDASPNSFYFYLGGLYDDPACQSGMGDLDHTVLAVGFATDPASGQVYSIVKNSWSSHWGDQGYVYISQQGNCCGVATQPTYTIL